MALDEATTVTPNPCRMLLCSKRARGVTGIGGAWVTDASALLTRMERGDRWGDATRKSSLRNDSTWPGLEELLRRAMC